MKTPNPFTICIYCSFKRSAAVCLLLLIGCLLLPKALAVDPPPDGGYDGGNTAVGDNALDALTTGEFNTAAGFYSLATVTTGQFNTAIGAGTLLFNTANQNTAAGAGALFNNTSGDKNTATGAFALVNNMTGAENTAVGDSALFNNTQGAGNTVVGLQAMYNNTRGNSNIAIGAQTLFTFTAGTANVAIGDQALYFKTIGVADVAVGTQALFRHTTGRSNTAIGDAALGVLTVGNDNTALGHGAGFNLTTGDFNIDIGALTVGVAGESGTIRIGASPNHTRAFIAGIRGVTTGHNDAMPVVIDSDGQLGTVSSSSRFKTDIKPIEKASESILALQPVSFRYKAHQDNTPNFGLIAEEVARVNPDLVIYDADGKPFTVRYDAVNAMLLNEFLKAHHRIQELEASNAQQQKQIDALNAGLQRVSAQIELSRPATDVVVNQQ
jgi:hypothetical protein